MKEKRLKYFLPAERSWERCCRPACLCGRAACLAARAFPGGCSRLDPWSFTQKRGEIQPSSPSLVLSRRLCWCWVLSYPGQRSCDIPSQDSIQGQQRCPQRGHKVHYCPRQAAITQRCRVQALQLRTWHQRCSRCQNQKGWWAGHGEQLRRWTHGPTFLSVEEGGTLPGFSAPHVNIYPLDLGPNKRRGRELLARLHLCFKQK